MLEIFRDNNIKMSELFTSTIATYASAVPPDSPQKNVVQKWWYIEMLKRFVMTPNFWYSLVGEAVYDWIIPLWKNECDFWDSLPPPDVLNQLGVDTNCMKVSVISMYGLETTYQALAELLGMLGGLTLDNEYQDYDEYTLSCYNGFGTAIKIFVYTNSENYKSPTTADTLLFSRVGWSVLTPSVDSYSPTIVRPTVVGDTTVDCPTNSHRSVLNILGRIIRKELVVLPDSDDFTLGKRLDSGWVAAPDTFLEFTKDFPRGIVCDICDEEITEWSARQKIDNAFYHPSCVPTL